MEKRDMMIDINPEGKYDEEKIVKKKLYEKHEKREVVVDINPEGKDDEEEVVEKQLVATEDAPELISSIYGQYDDAEEEAEDWKMKAEIRFAQNDVLDDAKEDTETNMFEEAETRMWIYGQNDDVEEEAENKGGTATEQMKTR
jgi:hypothetical protein